MDKKSKCMTTQSYCVSGAATVGNCEVNAASFQKLAVRWGVDLPADRPGWPTYCTAHNRPDTDLPAVFSQSESAVLCCAVLCCAVLEVPCAITESSRVHANWQMRKHVMGGLRKLAGAHSANTATRRFIRKSYSSHSFGLRHTVLFPFHSLFPYFNPFQPPSPSLPPSYSLTSDTILI